LPNKYYCDYCYYAEKLFIIFEFEDSDIEWNEDDPKDNLGIVKVSHLPDEKVHCYLGQQYYNQLIGSNDEVQFNKEDLPSMTLKKSKHNIISGVFTHEDM